MLKAVIDTNIIVSGTISSSGAPFEILEAWRDRTFMPATSALILKEVERVFEYPRIKTLCKLEAKEIKAILAALRDYSAFTPGKAKVNAITADPTDNMFLVCAKESEADFIVSGDAHILDLKSFEGIPIMTARRFIETIKRRTSKPL